MRPRIALVAILLAAEGGDPPGVVIPEQLLYYPTIDAVVDRIGMALRTGADGLEVEYDTEYGFPRRVVIDPNREYEADGTDIELRDFREFGPVMRIDR